MRNRSPARRAALLGLLTATAFALSALEQLVPLPLPGFKLGLANTVTLFCLYELSLRETLAVVTARCLLASLLFGGPVSLAFSLAGGLLAALSMAGLRRLACLSCYGVSMGGAFMHNLGQVLAAMAVMGSPSLAAYGLALWPLSIPAGALTALCYAGAARALRRAVGKKSP
jgi:heptaprenyl diphosphate synthase